MEEKRTSGGIDSEIAIYRGHVGFMSGSEVVELRNFREEVKDCWHNAGRQDCWTLFRQSS